MRFISYNMYFSNLSRVRRARQHLERDVKASISERIPLRDVLHRLFGCELSGFDEFINLVVHKPVDQCRSSREDIGQRLRGRSF